MNLPTKKAEMNLHWKLYEARFVERPNRFLTLVNFEGKIVESHLPDPGRLKELLLPNARLLIKKESNPNRKTKFSTQAVYLGDQLISINSWLPNQFVEYMVRNQIFPFISKWKFERREVKFGDSRFDFLLKNGKQQMIMEVKSVTLVENDIAKFPDAVTARGRKHLLHLAKLAQDGFNCMVLFVIQRDDAVEFQPQWERDPQFGDAIIKASDSGVDIQAVKLQITPDRIKYLSKVHVNLQLPEDVVA
jgi:sugar fermentation stimulation protein A